MTAFNREGQADRRLRSGRPKNFREQALPSALPVACRSGTGSARKRTFLSDNIQLVFGMGTDALTFKAVGMSLGLRCAYQRSFSNRISLSELARNVSFGSN
jgi:hypothetical protein